MTPALEYAREASTQAAAASVWLSNFMCRPVSCSYTCPASFPAPSRAAPKDGMPGLVWQKVLGPPDPTECPVTTLRRTTFPLHRVFRVLERVCRV